MTLSAFPVIFAVLLAFLAATLIARRDPFEGRPERVSTIDGLRGYLAFFVFLHNGVIWYYYLHSGKWGVMTSHVFIHLGQSSVALFFMITGFLFFAKLLSSRENGIDWTKLYVSRVLRLTPLYLLAIGCVLSIVVILSGGTLHRPAGDVLLQVGAWLGFTIPGMPDINGVKSTYTIIAGVPWSLPYEWLYYSLLPLFAVAIGMRVPKVYLAAALVVLVASALNYANPDNLILFAIGMASAVLVQNALFRKLASTKPASLLVLVCLFCAVNFYSSPHSKMPLLLLSVSFLVIAGGNSLFGILTHPVSRAFGETAYSVYLLHGILLFVTIHFVIGDAAARAFTPMQYWSMLLALTPVLVLISHVTFWYIEYPFMRATPRVTNALRRVLRSGVSRLA